MWYGVGLAVALCLASAAILEAVDRALPAQAAGGARNGPGPGRRGRRHLHGRVDEAPLPGAEGIAASGAPRPPCVLGSAWALVGMAFFAVLREGLETAVFLLAVFGNSTNPAATGTGAVLGIARGRRPGVTRSTREASGSTWRGSSGSRASCWCSSPPACWRPRSTPRTRPDGSTVLQAQAFDLRWLVAPGLRPRRAADRHARASSRCPPSARRSPGSLYAVPMGALRPVAGSAARRRPNSRRRADRA